MATCVLIIAAAAGGARQVAAQDLQPPSVTVMSPAPLATGVSVSVTVRATFNEPVLPSSIVFSVRNSQNVAAAGSVFYEDATRTVTFSLTQSLAGAATYQASVSATDLAGNAMPAPRTWTFQTALAGFQETVAWSGLSEPTVVEFSADGRVFVGEKNGLIKVFDGPGDTSATIFADLRSNTHNFWDRGLLGLALHPNFPTTPYVYVLYTHDAPIGGNAPRWGQPGQSSDPCPSPPGPTTDGCVVSGRLSRLTANGDQMVGAEQVLIEDWFQQFPSHSVGSLAFGSDGALYVSGGDGSSFIYADYGQTGNPGGDPPLPAGTPLSPPTAEGGSLRSQDLRTRGDPTGLNGSIIRVDPDTGTALPDNPQFLDSDPNVRRIIAHGFRNPFRIANRPGTREIWTIDTGWTSTEEVNRIVDPTDAVVENFGWPCYEGLVAQPGYDAANLNICEQLYNTPGAVAMPYISYNHGASAVPNDACGGGSASISALTFYSGQNFPVEYDGALFFGDYTRNCIWAMLKGTNGVPDPARRMTFRVGALAPVDLKIWNGDLYYVDVLGGTIRRITFFSGNQPPVASIDASTLVGPLPLTVTFDASGSSDPETPTLSFAWDLDADGAFDDSTTPVPSVTFTAPGSYVVSVRVTDAGGLSDIATTTVLAGQLGLPVPVISAPTGGTRWTVGQTVAFAGSATDSDDGVLPPAALSWSLVLHHCPSSCHAHPVQDFVGVASGSFVAPDHDYPSHLELTLTATDSSGLSQTARMTLLPNTVATGFDTNPSGIPLAVGSTSGATPFTRTAIQGSTIAASAPPAQLIGTDYYRFASWSDGGAQTHNIGPLSAPSSYVATFTQPTDATLLGTPIALIMVPSGGGNRNIATIRDGVFPPVGATDSARQFDTYTGDVTRAVDWLGYTFAAPQTFVGLTFQEGRHFGDGGWFTTLTVQVRSGGVWTDVTGFASHPSYPGNNGVTYERFALSFSPVIGDAIRIIGGPGGSARFVSVAELRVFVDAGAPTPLTLQSPNGGESLAVGAQYTVTWSPVSSTVNLSYRTSGAGAWLPIAQGVPGTPGSYQWTIPNTPTTQARVQVVATLNASMNDESNNDVSIVPASAVPQDITALGTPIALITAPLGTGNKNLNIIKDGVFPPLGSANAALQYDTYTGDFSRTFDWVGYQFAATHTFVGLTFQEGTQFFDGGWFTALRVQVLNGGTWTDVAVSSAPAYAGPNGVSAEQYVLTIPPTSGTGIRVAGTPGGSARFISIAELRVSANNAVPPAGSLTVTAPNGGETLAIGVARTLTWSASGVTTVNLAYRTSPTGAWLPIAQGIPATPASYQWLVPATATTQGRIRVSDAANTSVADESDGDFSIAQPAPVGSLTMTDPNGGETLTIGATRSVTWSATAVTTVNLAYRTSPTGAWLPIAQGIPATPASYQWLVPATATTQARIRVSDAANASVADESNGDFSIAQAPPTGTVQDITGQGTAIALITAPTGSGNRSLAVIADNVFPPLNSTNSALQYDTYTGDTSRTLDWIGYQFSVPRTFTELTFQEGPQFFDGGWFATLQVQVRNGGTWSDVAGLVSTPAYLGPNGVGFERFTLSFTPAVGDAIRVAGTPGGTARFISVGELRVHADAGQAALTLVSPNGSESWVVGTTRAVTWGAAMTASVNLEYRTSTTGNWLPIAADINAAAGTYPWTVPASLTSQARIRITDASNAAISDMSDADFAIVSTPPTTVDVTDLGTPIALITAPRGTGNLSLNVIKDGVFPPVGSANSAQQYDTYTGDVTRTFDWIGHQFSSPRTFVSVTFQEGRQFFDGGWLTGLTVQVRSGGVWTDVSGVVSAPAYPGANGVSFEQFVLSFGPVTGDAIRIAGTPGGSARFISVAELRVRAQP